MYPKWEALSHLLAEIDAVHLGHVPIGNHQADAAVPQEFQGLFAILGQDHVVLFLG